MMVGVCVRVGKVVGVVVGTRVSVGVGTGVSVGNGSVEDAATVGAWAAGLAHAPTARIMMTANNTWIFLCIATPQSRAQFYHQQPKLVKTGSIGEVS